MYRRKKLKVGIFRILILLAIILPVFWYASLPLSGWLAVILSDYGFTEAAYYIGRGTSPEVLSHNQLLRIKELSLLSSEFVANSDKTVFLNSGDIKLSEAKTADIFNLFESARKEVGPIVGYTPSVIRIRVVEATSVVHKIGFNGRYIDLPLGRLLDPYTVYHEVTHLATYGRLFSWNFPVSFPYWLDEGLADYIPSSLKKSYDYSLISREYKKGRLTLSGLDTFTLKEIDPYPACVAVGLIDELSGDSGGLARFLSLLAQGTHFVEALRIVTKLTETEFTGRWQERCNNSAVHMDVDSTRLERSSFLKGKVLYEKACQCIAQRKTTDAIKLLRESILEFDKVAPLAFGGGVAVEKRKTRELLAKQLIDQNSGPSSSKGEESKSGTVERKSIFATKVIFTQVMLLLAVICFYFLKLVVVPLLIVIFHKAFQSGSVITTCLLLYISLRFIKTMTGYVTCRFLLFYGGSEYISYSSLFLFYLWLSAMVMAIYGSLLMDSSGGGSGEEKKCTLRAFLSFSCISGLSLVVLYYLGYIKWSLVGNWIGPLIHAAILALFYAFAHETFFRGGLLKSAETKLHVGSSAVLTSLIWAIFIAFPSYSALRLTVAFISGMLFCSLVTTSASISAAVGGACALHFFDWFILDRGLVPFLHTMFASVNNSNPLLVPSLEASFTSLYWVPLVFSGWCLTLIVLKRSSLSPRSNRTSRLFISSDGY